MGIEILFLILAIAVVAFGIGVIVVSRRSSAPTSAPPPAGAPDDPASRDRRGAATCSSPSSPVEERRSRKPEIVEPVKPASLRDRLAKARLAFTGAFAGVLGRSGITDESFDDLEEALLRADVGVGVTTDLIDGLRAKVAAKEITEPQALLDALEAEMVSRLDGSDRSLAFDAGCRQPERVDVRRRQRRRQDDHHRQGRQPADADGRTVLMAAGDTFRAAAAEQLTTWAERSGAEIVRGAEGGDPELGHLRRRRAGGRPRASTSCWPTPPAACTRSRT